MHHAHTARARAGTPDARRRTSLLCTLELLTKADGLLPPGLRSPHGAKVKLNLPAVARQLQHAALTLLCGPGGGGVPRAFATRCCRVLRAVLDAVVKCSDEQLKDCLGSGSQPTHANRAKHGLVRRHAVTLVSALVPVACSGGAAATEALQLLKHAVDAVKTPVRAQLQPLPTTPDALAPLAELCQDARAYPPNERDLDAALLKTDGEDTARQRQRTPLKTPMQYRRHLPFVAIGAEADGRRRHVEGQLGEQLQPQRGRRDVEPQQAHTAAAARLPRQRRLPTEGKRDHAWT